MMSRVTLVLAAALALSGTAYAAEKQPAGVGSEGRSSAIAAQMSKGLSYDQASRAAREASAAEPSKTDASRVQAVATLVSHGMSYDRATLEVVHQAPIDVERVNARYTKHLAAMQQMGRTHDAGWTASNSE